MNTITVTLGELVDRTMTELAAPGEQGMRVVMGTTALDTTGATELTLTVGDGVHVSDVLEFGSELVLVTAKSSDAEPVFTVARGYYGTVPEVHAAGDPGLANPTHPRKRIAEALRRSFNRLEALGVPLIKAITVNRVPGYAYVELPNDVRTVEDVLYWGSDGRLLPLAGWEYYDHVPSGKFLNGKSLNVGTYVADADDLEVIYRAPYRWSNHPTAPVESDTIELPEGAEDLPTLYAAAWLTSAREISRADLDRSEEWGRTEQFVRGQSSTLVRARWQEFYRALDEARKLVQAPQRIVFRPAPRF